MNRIANILVIVDPTAQEHPAVTKAALLAKKLGARLELYVCDTKAAREQRLAAHAARAGSDEPFLVNVKTIAERIAEPLRAQGIDVTTETDCADPLHLQLVDRTKRTSAELVVKDTHHHSLAQRTFLTNTDWELMRSCPVPLLLVKPRPWAQRPRIAAALDPGHVNDKPAALDHEILEHASLLASRLNGELHVVHAYVPLSVIAAAASLTPPMVSTLGPEELAIEQRAKRKQLEELVAGYRLPPENIHIELGGPTDLLPRFASAMQIDVLTMGAISRSGLKRIFIGSTAEDVLERLPCDALIIKPPDFAALLPF